MGLCRQPRASLPSRIVPVLVLVPPLPGSINSSPAIEVLLIQTMAIPHNVPFPSGGTWFDTLHKTFDDVHVQTDKDNGIPTGEFLEAAQSLTTLFGEGLFTFRASFLPPSRHGVRNG